MSGAVTDDSKGLPNAVRVAIGCATLCTLAHATLIVAMEKWWIGYESWSSCLGVLGLCSLGASAIGIAGTLSAFSAERGRFVGCGSLLVAMASLLLCAAGMMTSARKGSNEAATIGSIRVLIRAQSQYRNGHSAYALTLADLMREGLISSELATGRARRYLFSMQSTGDRWNVVASPFQPGDSGDRYFFVDESGTIRFSTTETPTNVSTAIGG